MDQPKPNLVQCPEREVKGAWMTDPARWEAAAEALKFWSAWDLAADLNDHVYHDLRETLQAAYDAGVAQERREVVRLIESNGHLPSVEVVHIVYRTMRGEQTALRAPSAPSEGGHV